LEEWFIESTYTYSYIINIGLFIMLFGQFFRISSLFKAGSNFNHTIETTKAKDHILVTSGVYRYKYLYILL